MKKTILTLIAILLSIQVANAGIDRMEHYEKARKTVCITIYLESAGYIGQDKMYMCEDVYKVLNRYFTLNPTNFYKLNK